MTFTPEALEFFSTNKMAAQILDDLVQRQLPRQTIDVYRLRLRLAKAGMAFGDYAMMKHFRQWEALGLGKFEVERLPAHSRFLWAVEAKYAVPALQEIAAAS